MTDFDNDKAEMRKLKAFMDQAIEKARAARQSLSTSLRLLSTYERQANQKRELSTELPVRVKRLKFIYQQTFKLDRGYDQLIKDRKAGIKHTERIVNRNTELAVAHGLTALGKVAELYFATAKVSCGMKAFLAPFESINDYGGIAKELGLTLSNAAHGKTEDASLAGVAAISKIMKVLGTDATALSDLLSSTNKARKPAKPGATEGDRTADFANLIKLLKSITKNLQALMEIANQQSRGSTRVGALADLMGPVQSIVELIASALKASEAYSEAIKLAKMSGTERFNIREMIGWSDQASFKELAAFSEAVYGEHMNPAKEQKAALGFLTQIKTARSASAWRQALLNYVQEAKQQIQATSEITQRLQKDFRSTAARLPEEFERMSQAFSDMCEAFAKLRAKADHRWGYVDITLKTVKREIDQFATTASEASHRLMLLHALRLGI